MPARFHGFDHIDTRVRSLKSVEPFYDKLMAQLGLPRKHRARVDEHGDWHDADAGKSYNAAEYHEEPVAGRAAFFIGFIEDPTTQPTRTRIAFRVPQGELGHWSEFLNEIGARNIEPSADLEDYPAVFFEDPVGTKLEVVARRPHLPVE